MSQGPSVSLRDKILNNFRIFLLFYIIISTPNRSLQTDQNYLTCSCTWRYGFPSCQVVNLQLLAHSKRSAFFTIVNVFSPRFPVRSVAASNLLSLSLSKILYLAYVSVYIIIHDKNMSLCKYMQFKHLIGRRFSKKDPKPVRMVN